MHVWGVYNTTTGQGEFTLVTWQQLQRIYSDLCHLWWSCRHEQPEAALHCLGTGVGIQHICGSQPHLLLLPPEIPSACPSPPQNTSCLPLHLPSPPLISVSAEFSQCGFNFRHHCGSWIWPQWAHAPLCASLACFFRGAKVLYATFAAFLI